MTDRSKNHIIDQDPGLFYACSSASWVRLKRLTGLSVASVKNWHALITAANTAFVLIVFQFFILSRQFL